VVALERPASHAEQAHTLTRTWPQAANIKAALARRAADAARRRHRVEAPSTPTPSEAQPHTDQQVRHWLSCTTSDDLTLSTISQHHRMAHSMLRLGSGPQGRDCMPVAS
jgi:hypothetical protein